VQALPSNCPGGERHGFADTVSTKCSCSTLCCCTVATTCAGETFMILLQLLHDCRQTGLSSHSQQSQFVWQSISQTTAFQNPSVRTCLQAQEYKLI
jgi:hypothetical protein